MKPVTKYIMISLAVLYTNDSPAQKTTVTGKALDAKAGAVVQTEQQTYYIDKLASWDRKFYGRKVKVSGIVVTIHEKPETKDSLLVQKIAGDWKLIKNAKWELVE